MGRGLSAGRREGYAEGARAAAPIGVAAFAFGISFGVLAQAAGLGGLAAVVMSGTTFAGSAQFAATSVLGAGGGAVAAIAAALLLNGRYAAISISVAPAFRGSLVRRVVESQLIVDESWAIAVASKERFDRRVLIGAGLVLYVGWVGGTAVGAAGAGFLGDPEQLGLDAAFPALFLALLARQLGSTRAVAAALAGAAIALALVPFTPAGVPIIAASAACLIALVRG